MSLVFSSVLVATTAVAGLLWFIDPSSDQLDGVLILQDRQNTEITVLLSVAHQKSVLAHYTEHLAFLPNIGKDSRPEDRDSNAWTTDLTIGYWMSGPPEDLPEMLGRLKVVFDPINLPLETAETERDIVLREYDLRVANNPDALAAEEMEAFLYQGNAIAGSVIGTPAQIRAMTYDEAKAFHLETHRPERARLVVIGDVSHRLLADAITASGFPDLAAKGDEVTPPPFLLAAPDTRIFRYPDANAAPRMTWRKVVALPEPMDFDLLQAQAALTRDILDTNLPGGLAGPLRFDAFITKSFGLSIVPIDQTHIELTFSAEPDKGIRFSTMQSAFEAALAAAAKGVPAATYDRVRDRFNGFWPDWSDQTATARWMADYTLARISILREPKSEDQIRKIDGQINEAGVHFVLAALAGTGRTAIAFIGTDSIP